MSMESKLLDAVEVGEKVGLSRRTVLSLARRDLIPSIKRCPRIIRFDYDDVVAALKKVGAKKARVKK